MLDIKPHRPRVEQKKGSISVAGEDGRGFRRREGEEAVKWQKGEQSGGDVRARKVKRGGYVARRSRKMLSLRGEGKEKEEKKQENWRKKRLQGS